MLLMYNHFQRGYRIPREASARLLVLLYRAMPEPLIAGRATSMALTLFLLTSSNAIRRVYGFLTRVSRIQL